MDKAERLSHVQLLKLSGYGPYLLARGRYEDALGLAKLYEVEYDHEAVFLYRAALIYYAMRRFEQARLIALELVDRERHFWLVHLVLGFIFVAVGDSDAALAHTSKMEDLAGARVWPGVVILCLALAGRGEEAQEHFVALIAQAEHSYVQPLQVALGYMALDKPIEAIEFIERACAEFDPFTAWLHLYPQVHLNSPLNRPVGDE